MDNNNFFLCFVLWFLLSRPLSKIIDQTRTMADVYGAFFDFCCIMESKVYNMYYSQNNLISALSSGDIRVLDSPLITYTIVCWIISFSSSCVYVLLKILTPSLSAVVTYSFYRFWSLCHFQILADILLWFLSLYQILIH